MCESTMKYFSPFFSYKAQRLLTERSRSLCRSVPGDARPALTGFSSLLFARQQCSGSARSGGQIEAGVLGPLLRVGEHDGAVVEVDHAAVVGRHVLLELGRVEEAGLLAEGLGDLVVDDVHPPDGVDPHHGWQGGHGHVRLGRHDRGDHFADLVVHQREAAPARRGVVRLERGRCGLELLCGHWASSFGTSRCRSVTMPENRLLAASRPSSNLGGFMSVCDHSGCSLRAASMARDTQSVRQPRMMVLFWSANSRAVVSRPNIAVV